MPQESWYVVDFAFDAPHDAGEGHHHVVSFNALQATIASRDPEELLCDLGLWIVVRKRVLDLLDMRPFVAIGEGARELRWSDEAGFIERFEAAAAQGVALVPRVVWSEVERVLPALETPVLAPGADDSVVNPKDVGRLARERNMQHTWRPAGSR